jgi:hypothetical protein
MMFALGIKNIENKHEIVHFKPQPIQDESRKLFSQMAVSVFHDRQSNGKHK